MSLIPWLKTQLVSSFFFFSFPDFNLQLLHLLQEFAAVFSYRLHILTFFIFLGCGCCSRCCCCCLLSPASVMLLFANSLQKPNFGGQKCHTLIIVYARAAVQEQLCASGTFVLAFPFAMVNIFHNRAYCSLVCMWIKWLLGVGARWYGLFYKVYW